LRLSQLDERLGRLTDAYIDRVIERDLFEQRKTTLLMEKKGLEEQQAILRGEAEAGPKRVAEILELAGSASLCYDTADTDERRDLVDILTSNRIVGGKNVDFMLRIPFSLIAERFKTTNGAPYRDIPRTWDRVIAGLLEFAKANPGFRVSRAADPFEAEAA
jgi:hypothetical protein